MDGKTREYDSGSEKLTAEEKLTHLLITLERELPKGKYRCCVDIPPASEIKRKFPSLLDRAEKLRSKCKENGY